MTEEEDSIKNLMVLDRFVFLNYCSNNILKFSTFSRKMFLKKSQKGSFLFVAFQPVDGGGSI